MNLSLYEVDNGFCRVSYRFVDDTSKVICYQECHDKQFELFATTPYGEPSHTYKYENFIKQTPLPAGNSTIEKLLRKWLVKQVVSDINHDVLNYYSVNGRPTEFDMSINDLSRRVIERINEVYGQCYLINITLRGDDRNNRDAVAVPYQTGEKWNAFNFCADYASPLVSEELKDLILEWNTSRSSKKADTLNLILQCAENLGAQTLSWA